MLSTFCKQLSRNATNKSDNHCPHGMTDVGERTRVHLRLHCGHWERLHYRGSVGRSVGDIICWWSWQWRWNRCRVHDPLHSCRTVRSCHGAQHITILSGLITVHRDEQPIHCRFSQQIWADAGNAGKHEQKIQPSCCRESNRKDLSAFRPEDCSQAEQHENGDGQCDRDLRPHTGCVDQGRTPNRQIEQCQKERA